MASAATWRSRLAATASVARRDSASSVWMTTWFGSGAVGRHAQQLHGAVRQVPLRRRARSPGPVAIAGMPGGARSKRPMRVATRVCMRAPSVSEQRRIAQFARGRFVRGHGREARDRRRQHVDAARADGDALADRDREIALLGQRARHLEQGALAGGTVASRRHRHGTVAGHAHAQALDRAAEQHFLDLCRGRRNST